MNLPPLSMLERYLGIAGAIGACLATWWLTHSLDAARLAKAEARGAELTATVAQAYAGALEAARATEALWAENLAKRDKDHADELARLRAARNPGPGAPVRVCQPTDPGPGGTAAPYPALAAVAGDPAAAGGLVPDAVPEGADLGPMLRAVIARGDELAAQVRALLAEREGLVRGQGEPLF